MSAGLAFADSGSGAPLVLLHAFPFDRHFWNGVTPLLNENFRVIAPDLLGFGNSGATAQWSIADQGEAVSELLTSLGLQSASIVGLSMGGYVALALAANHPGQVASLILADTKAAPDAPKARAGREEAIALVLSQGVAAFADGMVGKLLGPHAHQDVHRSTRRLMNQPQHTVVTALKALRDRPDRRPDLPSVTAPCLVLGGTFDTISPPAEGREIAAALPNAQFVEIAGAGHLTNLEAPAAFAKIVTEFSRDRATTRT